MSPNRKADLQRKLAMAPIPKPPAGLAERIKSDIPQHLLVDVRKERERFSRAISFNLRVAASVILLIGSVYLALHVLTSKELERTTMEQPSNVVLARKAPATAVAPARTTEAPVELPKSVTAPAAAPEEKRVIVAEAKTEPLAKREQTRDVDAVAGGSAAGNAAPPPAPMAAPAPVVPQPLPESIVVTAEAPRVAAKVNADLVPAATAGSLELAPSTLFDIAVPRPDAALRGPALIQHFAAPAAPTSALHVEAEAAMLDDTPLLRVSVDTPEVEHAAGGSQPPAAAGAALASPFAAGGVVAPRDARHRHAALPLRRRRPEAHHPEEAAPRGPAQVGRGVAADEERVARGGARRLADVEGGDRGGGGRGGAQRARRRRRKTLRACMAERRHGGQSRGGLCQRTQRAVPASAGGRRRSCALTGNARRSSSPRRAARATPSRRPAKERAPARRASAPEASSGSGGRARRRWSCSDHNVGSATFWRAVPPAPCSES